MNTVLVVLAVLGIGAIVISAYVFAASARRYVSEDESAKTDAEPTETDELSRLYVVRSSSDRRNTDQAAQFPLQVGASVIQQERRARERRTING